MQWVGPQRHGDPDRALGRAPGRQLALRLRRDGMEFGFHGCFHEVRPDRIVQTFTYDGEPDAVALQTLWFEDLGDGS